MTLRGAVPYVARIEALLATAGSLCRPRDCVP